MKWITGSKRSGLMYVETNYHYNYGNEQNKDEIKNTVTCAYSCGYIIAVVKIYYIKYITRPVIGRIPVLILGSGVERSIIRGSIFIYIRVLHR
jgi:hypothetical protein